MKEVFHEAVNELEKGSPVVVATVVRTKGSTPQKPGAKLLVREDGSGVGTLGGGCVEGDIWFAAKQLMKRGGPAQYRDYLLNEELAAEDGLVCGGTMYFLIDPVYDPGDYLSYAREIDEAYQGGPSVALASLIESSDNGPASTGQKLFIREDGSTEGTLGVPELDHEAVEKARGLMVHGRNDYVVSEDGTEYFIEAYTTPPQLVLCGGGHVSKAIAPLAKSVGFRVFITDDREEFVNRDRFPEADILVAQKPEDALPQLPINPNTFIIIATRGHRYDNVALEAAVKTAGSVRRPPRQQAQDSPHLRRPHAQRRPDRAHQGDPLSGRPGHPRQDPRGDRRKHHGRGPDVPARGRRLSLEAGGVADREDSRQGRG